MKRNTLNTKQKKTFSGNKVRFPWFHHIKPLRKPFTPFIYHTMQKTTTIKGEQNNITSHGSWKTTGDSFHGEILMNIRDSLRWSSICNCTTRWPLHISLNHIKRQVLIEVVICRRRLIITQNRLFLVSSPSNHLHEGPVVAERI